MIQILGENLISALKTAIAAQSEMDKVVLKGGVSGHVAVWREVLDAVEHGEPVTIKLVSTPKQRPKPKVFGILDLKKAATAKGATISGCEGDYSVDAPDGYKWDGDLHSFVVYWSMYNGKSSDPKDRQAALADAIDRINNATLEKCDESEDG